MSSKLYHSLIQVLLGPQEGSAAWSEADTLVLGLNAAIKQSLGETGPNKSDFGIILPLDVWILHENFHKITGFYSYKIMMLIWSDT